MHCSWLLAKLGTPIRPDFIIGWGEQPAATPFPGLMADVLVGQEGMPQNRV